MDDNAENDLLAHGFIRRENNIHDVELSVHESVRRDVVVRHMNIRLAVIALCASYHSIEYIHDMDQYGNQLKI